jgi:predicted nuclease with TOPRIM domain
MARSSITCSTEQRDLIDDLKRELAIALGKKSKRDVTDREFVQILLDTYTEHKNKSLLSLAKELANQLEGIVSLLTIAEDYERLRQEVEELRKENEELRRIINEKGGYIEDYESAKEQFCDFLKKEIERMGGPFKKDLEEALEFLRASKSPAQFLLRIYTAFVEPKRKEEEERTRRANSDAEIRYGGRLW